MKNVRSGVFETNSSSSHSVSIFSSGKIDTTSLIPDENGNIVLEGGEFGWEVDEYTDARMKANYIAVYAVMQDNMDERNKFVSMIKDVIKKQTKCKDVIFGFANNSGSYCEAYIDHQSVDDNQLHYIFDDEKTLFDLIFNKDSAVNTDNDNH